MNYKTIELQILQLEESFSKSRSNIYSDKKKEDHFLELYNLFKAIEKSDYKEFDIDTLTDHSIILNYIFKGLEYLDNSTLNIIPYEIVSCLEFALNDWIKRESFIIVTSLSNKNLDFHFDSQYSDEFLQTFNNYISSRYNLMIEHRLIKISLPKVLSRDYLSSVVLYHELGHFIDSELNISRKLLFNSFGVDTPADEHQQRYFNHKMEYFADLFAAQYINYASNLYLNHIAYDHPDSDTHPATISRMKVVDQFLSGEVCRELDEFNNALKLSGSPEIKVRFKEIAISKSDFLRLVPQQLNSKEELHYIFKLGWEFWNNSDLNFLKSFKSKQKYHIINNLIEKSISNYTITQKWQEISSKELLG